MLKWIKKIFNCNTDKEQACEQGKRYFVASGRPVESMMRAHLQHQLQIDPAKSFQATNKLIDKLSDNDIAVYDKSRHEVFAIHSPRRYDRSIAIKSKTPISKNDARTIISRIEAILHPKVMVCPEVKIFLDGNQAKIRFSYFSSGLGDFVVPACISYIANTYLHNTIHAGIHDDANQTVHVFVS